MVIRCCQNIRVSRVAVPKDKKNCAVYKSCYESILFIWQTKTCCHRVVVSWQFIFHNVNASRLLIYVKGVLVFPKKSHFKLCEHWSSVACKFYCFDHTSLFSRLWKVINSFCSSPLFDPVFFKTKRATHPRLKDHVAVLISTCLNLHSQLSGCGRRQRIELLTLYRLYQQHALWNHFNDLYFHIRTHTATLTP